MRSALFILLIAVGGSGGALGEEAALGRADQRARLRLEERLRQCELDGGQTLGRWLQRDAERDVRFSAWVGVLPRAAVLCGPTVCAVRVEARADDLRRVVREIALSIPRADDPARGPHLKAGEFELWGEIGLANAAELEEEAEVDLVEAARAMAAQSLIEAAGALRVSPADRLGAWLERRPALRAAVMGQMPEAISVGVKWEGAFATAEASLELRALVELLEAAVAEQSATLAAGVDFVDMFSLNNERALAVTTKVAMPLADAPAAKHVRAATAGWAGRTLEAGGRADGAGGDRELAVERATFVAQQALRDQLSTLAHPRGGTLGNVAAQDAALRAAMDAVVYFTKPAGALNECADGGVEVRLSLSLDVLAGVLEQGTRAGGG